MGEFFRSEDERRNTERLFQDLSNNKLYTLTQLLEIGKPELVNKKFYEYKELLQQLIEKVKKGEVKEKPTVTLKILEDFLLRVQEVNPDNTEQLQNLILEYGKIFGIVPGSQGYVKDFKK